MNEFYTKKQSSISVVFPMYNEKEYIQIAIEQTDGLLNLMGANYEIIIVDDASNDSSGDIADSLARANNRIKVFHHKDNRKLGGALRTGFSKASKDIIVYTDIDLPFDLSIIKEVIPLIKETDIIQGYRIGMRESTIRVIYSKIYNLLIKLVFGLKVKDVNFSMKIFKREILEHIKLKSEGSFINAEFLTKAQNFGYKIKEVGIEYRPRSYGISRLSSANVILKILLEMIKFYPEIKAISKQGTVYNKLKELYRNTGLKTKIYNFIRYKTCPFEIIERYVPKEGIIVDLGCGYGMFTNLLALKSESRTILGMDLDKDRIEVAMGTIKGRKNLKFEKNDIKIGLKATGNKCIVLIDVLYLIPYSTQECLLREYFDSLIENGILILKDMQIYPRLKYWWNMMQEFFSVRIFHSTLGSKFYFRKKEDYISLLQEIGFSVECIDIDKGYSYPHILYICNKKEHHYSS